MAAKKPAKSATKRKVPASTAPGTELDAHYIPDHYVGKLEPTSRYCRHWNPKRGKYCRARPGAGTDHVGQGRCKFGGGATPITSGRYSMITRPRIADLLAKLEHEADPLDMIPDLRLARAMLIDFIERYDEWKDAFLDWHASYHVGDGPVKPRQVLDVSDAVRHIDTISKVIERIEKIRAADAISRPDLLRVLTEMTRIVDLEVEDKEARRRIRDGWKQIRLG